MVVRYGVILDTDVYEANIAGLRCKPEEIDVVSYGNSQSIMNTI